MSKLIVYSGGMDSTVLLHEQARSIRMAVSFDYGSKHSQAEYECAKYQTDLLNIPLLRIPLGFIAEHFQSHLLTGGGEIPDGHYTDPVMRQTVVPFRNGIMLAVACGLAESQSLEAVLLANHAGDHPIYPDCRPAFVNAMAEAMRTGTYEGIRLESPFVELDKREIARRGRSLGVDFAHTWSCYKGHDLHCGRCGTCVERQEALAGFDPTQYQQKLES